MSTIKTPSNFQLIRITPDSPNSIQQAVVKHEKVHPLSSTNQLHNRLVGNRTIFGLIETNSLPSDSPNDLLYFVSVSFLHNDSFSTIEQVKDGKSESVENANTAVFYSINAAETKSHHRGKNLGGTLIKNVIAHTRKTSPSVQNFMTFSPIPRFNKYLQGTSSPSTNTSSYSKLLEALCDIERRTPDVVKNAEPVLRQECLKYISNETIRNDKNVGCPVARFHMNNGACLWKIYWAADLSPKRLEESTGMMVSYLYASSNYDFSHPRSRL